MALFAEETNGSSRAATSICVWHLRCGFGFTGGHPAAQQWERSGGCTSARTRPGSGLQGQGFRPPGASTHPDASSLRSTEYRAKPAAQGRHPSRESLPRWHVRLARGRHEVVTRKSCISHCTTSLLRTPVLLSQCIVFTSDGCVNYSTAVRDLETVSAAEAVSISAGAYLRVRLGTAV